MKVQSARRLGLALLVAGITCVPLTWALPWLAAPSEPPLRPEMVLVLEQPTTFVMGSPETEEGRDDDEAQRQITLTRPFLIARTEVTQAQYAAVMGSNPSCSEYEGVSLIDPDYPVQCLSWLDAVAYCNRLSELEGLGAAYVVKGEEVQWNREAKGYRLPTEAEWEFAARAGGEEVYAGTSTPEEVCDFGNVRDRSYAAVIGSTSVALVGLDSLACDDYAAGLAKVRSYSPNRWFLYDMTGNVWEWTWDWYEPNPTETQDPDGPGSGSNRVDRGGSWWGNPANARVAIRDRSNPSGRGYNRGFRPARSL